MLFEKCGVLNVGLDVGGRFSRLRGAYELWSNRGHIVGWRDGASLAQLGKIARKRDLADWLVVEIRPGGGINPLWMRSRASSSDS